MNVIGLPETRPSVIGRQQPVLPDHNQHYAAAFQGFADLFSPPPRTERIVIEEDFLLAEDVNKPVTQKHGPRMRVNSTVADKDPAHAEVLSPDSLHTQVLHRPRSAPPLSVETTR
jgi:hypothetical protein